MKAFQSDRELAEAASGGRWLHDFDEFGRVIDVPAVRGIYRPAVYRGGAVVPGFGYSVERIAKGFISADEAGEPYAVMP